MQEHLCQKYSKDDFTEAYYNSLFKHLYTSLAFQTMCILNEAEISPISVTVEKDATTNIYLYTAKIDALLQKRALEKAKIIDEQL